MVQAEIHEHLKDVAVGPDENMMRMLFEAEPDPALVFLDAVRAPARPPRALAPRPPPPPPPPRPFAARAESPPVAAARR